MQKLSGIILSWVGVLIVADAGQAQDLSAGQVLVGCLLTAFAVAVIFGKELTVWLSE